MKNAGELALSAAQGQVMESATSPLTRKLFVYLHANYGTLFSAKYATGVKDSAGHDLGVKMAMRMWDSDLSKFPQDVVEMAARRCVENDPKYPPNLPELVAICRSLTPKPSISYPHIEGPKPMKVAFDAKGDELDWARSLVARHEAGDRTVGRAALATARQALKGREFEALEDVPLPKRIPMPGEVHA